MREFASAHWCFESWNRLLSFLTTDLSAGKIVWIHELRIIGAFSSLFFDSFRGYDVFRYFAGFTTQIDNSDPISWVVGPSTSAL